MSHAEHPPAGLRGSRHDHLLGARATRLGGVAILGRIYHLVTRRSPSAQVTVALQQFPGYAIGIVAARVLSLLGQLYIARSLGPEQFGLFGLSLAVAMVLTIPMQGGWGQAFVKFAAVRPASEGPSAEIAAMLRLTALSSVTVGTVALFGTSLGLRWLAIPAAPYVAGVMTAIAATVWFQAKSTCQGLQAWSRLVSVELIWAAGVLAVPIVWQHVAGSFDWRIVWTLAVLYVLASLPAVGDWRGATRQPVGPHMRQLWQFGKYVGSATLLAALLVQSDRFLVNAALGLHALGVYQVYTLTTVATGTIVAGLVNGFAFPLLNRGDRAAFRRLFLQALPWWLVSFVASVSLLGWIALYLLRYPVHHGVLVVGALSGFAYCVMSFLCLLAATDERRGPRAVLHAHLLACAVFFPAAVGLLPSCDIMAPFLAYLLAFGAGAALVYHRLLAFEHARDARNS